MIAPSIVFSALAAFIVAVNGSAFAQPFPSRPITIIVPFPAGGPSDALGRVMAEHMRGALGQPVVVENVTGANGAIGVGRVARAAGDGYTLGVGALTTHVFNGAFYTLPYDLEKDFEPVSLLAKSPQLVVSKTDVPAQDVKQLVAWLKANEGKVSAGTAGPGSASHVSGVLFQNLTGTRFQFVPYRGNLPALQDVLAGRLDLMVDLAVNSLPQLRAGRIRAYAVMEKARLSVAPDIPTADEAGLPGFHMSIWLGLWAPKATPKNVIARLNASVMDGWAEPAVRQRLTDLGMEVFPREQQTPEALGAFQRAEIEKWWPIIKAANIKVE